VTMFRAQSVFLNSCLHTMGHFEYSMTLAVDMEGNTWRQIDMPPSGCQNSMHQSQGHLCVCLVDGPNDSMLLVWILEAYSQHSGAIWKD
jgi:hypothetical protein